MRLWLIIAALLLSLPGFADESWETKEIRKMCAEEADYLQCTDYAFGAIAVSFRFDKTFPRRVFIVTPDSITKALTFLDDQTARRPPEYRTTVHKADPANDWISELEYKRNVVNFLETSCLALSGTCIYLAGKVKLSSWGVFVYSACGTSAIACRIRGEDDIKRFDEEIKQIKQACAEGQDDAKCLRRVQKGKNARLLPADNPPPRPDPWNPENDPEYDPNRPGNNPGSDGGWTVKHPHTVCISDTIGSSGGPLGETIEETVTCYEI